MKNYLLLFLIILIFLALLPFAYGADGQNSEADNSTYLSNN